MREALVASILLLDTPPVCASQVLLLGGGEAIVGLDKSPGVPSKCKLCVLVD